MPDTLDSVGRGQDCAQLDEFSSGPLSPHISPEVAKTAKVIQATVLHCIECFVLLFSNNDPSLPFTPPPLLTLLSGKPESFI